MIRAESDSDSEMPENPVNNPVKETEPTVQEQKKAECPICHQVFISPFSVRRHVRRVHKDEDNMQSVLNTLQEGKSICMECGLKFRRIRDLRQHLIKNHGFHFRQEILKFDNNAAFEEWKSDLEETCQCKYVRHRGDLMDAKQRIKTSFYQCKGKGIRKGEIIRRKGQGAWKAERNCTSSIKIETLENGTMKVYVCHSHYGHPVKLKNLFLTERQKRSITSKIHQKIPRDAILDGIRDSAATSSQRLSLLQSKDMQDILRDFGLNANKLNQSEQYNLSVWIRDWACKDDNPVLYSKLEGDEAQGFQKEDFIIILQTSYQKQMLVEFGSQGILVESSNGTNLYDFLLTTMSVVDEFGKAEAVGWCMSNKENYESIVLFFETIRGYCGEIKPKWLMTDITTQFLEAFKAVNDCDPFPLIHAWDVDRAWRDELREQIGDTVVEADIYKMLCTMVGLIDIKLFEDYLTDFTSHLMLTKKALTFANDFQKYWIPKKELWAYCYRAKHGINPNTNIESFYSVLEYRYLAGKYNRRVDSCLIMLFKYNRDRAFERLTKLRNTKFTELDKRHEDSVTMSNTNVLSVGVQNWNILPEQQEDKDSNTYTVKLSIPKCPFTNCLVMCKECNVCSHIFSCTCMDFLTNRICCKHIHLVQRARKKPSEARGDHDYFASSTATSTTQSQLPEMESLEMIRTNLKKELACLASVVNDAKEQDKNALTELHKRIVAVRSCVYKKYTVVKPNQTKDVSVPLRVLLPKT